MRKLIIYIIISVTLILTIAKNTTIARSLVKPLLYPINTISINQPHLIWKDIYSSRYKKQKINFRISLKELNTENTHTYNFTYTPKLYFKQYYAFKIPEALKGKEYRYTIEKLVNKKPRKSKYYYYMRYPIINSFKIDTDEKNNVDFLPPEYLIKYKFYEKENMLINGYNFMFYSTSSTISLGIAYLFYSMISLGTISTVISLICITSSAVGYSASGYYGYQYMEYNGRMNKILDIGSRVSIKGNIQGERLNTKVELSF